MPSPRTMISVPWLRTGRTMTSLDNWGLPRSTGNIDADRSAALLAERTAKTDAQRAAVAVRLADIRAREGHGAEPPGPTGGGDSG
jgi:hypothetical protein